MSGEPNRLHLDDFGARPVFPRLLDSFGDGLKEGRGPVSERAMRTRQRALDLDLPMQRRDAA